MDALDNRMEIVMKILGRAEDPKFWSVQVKEREVYKAYRDELIAYWNNKGLESLEFKNLKYSDFKLFWTTGDRSIYEGQYFARRYALEHTVPLALIYPEEEKYIDRIMDWVYALCDEYTWCLPAHQGQLEPNNNSRIDLFAAETGYTLAIIYRLLGDRLDPLIKNRIMAEVERRIVRPFLAVDNYGWWEVGHSNWTAVCTGGVAGAFMLLFPELVDGALIARFNKAIDLFLEGFKDDGICLEGCGYWAYGFGFFLQYADMIRSFTEGRVDYFKLPKVRTIATFPQKMFLSGSATVSFADGGRRLDYVVGVMHRLKSEYPDDVLVYSPKYAAFGIGCGRLCYRIYSASWLVEDYWYNPDDSTAQTEYYAADSEWFVKRCAAYGFAAKAGNNNELHNHNDVGSFIFAKDGEQMIMDLGAGKYTRQYFDGNTRYGILECGSSGHNLPIIDGRAQLFGSEHRATDVHYEEGCFSMDIAGAYEVEGLRSVKRSFRCTDKSVMLVDDFDYDGSGDIIERIVSTKKPEFVSDGVIAFGTARLTYVPTLCDVSVSELHGSAGNNDPCYAVNFKLGMGARVFSCTME